MSGRVGSGQVKSGQVGSDLVGKGRVESFWFGPVGSVGSIGSEKQSTGSANPKTTVGNGESSRVETRGEERVTVGAELGSSRVMVLVGKLGKGPETEKRWARESDHTMGRLD